MSFVSLRSPRFAKRQAEKIHSILTFTIAETSLALSLDAALQVFPLDCPQPDPQDLTACLTHYQNRELKVVDLGDRWFNRPLAREGENLSVLVVQNREGDRLGILLPSPPNIHHLPESDFSSLDTQPVPRVPISCLETQQIRTGEDRVLYRIEVEMLLKSCIF